jgi:Lanthionine synthetase C-like protein
MVLFRPEEHEPLVDVAWDEPRARDAIAAIVADAEGAVEDGVWPVHPQDADPDVDPSPTTLYLGSAGVVWALHTFGSRLDLGAIMARALERYRERPDFAPDFGDEPSLPMGESGLLLVARIVGSAAADDARLIERIRENRVNETWEWLWGSPGTMLAARELGADDAWRESAELLWAQWDEETDLWTQHLYGRVGQHLGPAHGFAGNVHALRGFRPDDELRARVAPVVERTALRDDGLASWPPAPDSRPDELRVQWCHGAPGLVATIGDLMPRELAVAGAELTWRAGPLVKGSSLCHGTAGNGYALLRVFDLTGDELWLDRAQRFAMHAIAQVDRTREQVGRGRYTLWTGDPGVALYLRSCLDADARVPTMDFW